MAAFYFWQYFLFKLLATVLLLVIIMPIQHHTSKTVSTKHVQNCFVTGSAKWWKNCKKQKRKSKKAIIQTEVIKMKTFLPNLFIQISSIRSWFSSFQQKKYHQHHRETWLNVHWISSIRLNSTTVNVYFPTIILVVPVVHKPAKYYTL